MTQAGGVGGGSLTGWISLGVLASAVPRDAVDEAVAVTGKGAQRAGGKLPPHVVVYLVMALALFAGDDLPRAFRTADLRLIHAAVCCSRYSRWTCCGVRY